MPIQPVGIVREHISYGNIIVIITDVPIQPVVIVREHISYGNIIVIITDMPSQLVGIVREPRLNLASRRCRRPPFHPLSYEAITI